MDVVMPEMSGIEACKKILKETQMPRSRHLRDGTESLVMEAINAGARDYLLKPFTPRCFESLRRRSSMNPP